MEGNDELEVKTSFGSLKAGGSVVVIVIVVICCSIAIGYMIRDHDMRTQERGFETRKQVTDLRDAMNEQTFVLTLTEKDRQALRLDMPETLRRKTGR